MYTKKALIRAEDGSYMYVQCECGAKTTITGNSNTCACGIVYDGSGWIHYRPTPSHIDADTAASEIIQPVGKVV